MASAGTGSQSHLNGTSLLIAGKFESLHVPYKGGGPAVAAVVAGESQWTLPPSGAVMTQVRAGRLRAIGQTFPQRSPLLGDIPAIAETIPGFHYVALSGFLAPKGVSRHILEKIHATVERVVGTSEIRQQFAMQGAEPTTGKPEQFRKAMHDELIDAGRLVKIIGLTAE